ncbi:MAG: DUF1016 N-terminal domain-containing protein [Leptospira sp.]|nr:DUF1016 N-terminal domain-containing protein [Leptospira sp.]
MKQKESKGISATDYHSLLKDISQIYEVSLSDGTENWNKTALFSNWKIGERIVKIEQGNQNRAAYGIGILKNLSRDLNRKFGKGFSERNLAYMRSFYQVYDLRAIHPELSWSHYTLLMSVADAADRLGLEKKTIREGLSLLELRKFVDKVIAREAEKPGAGVHNKPMKDRLQRPSMELYTYRVSRNFSSDFADSLQNLDLGFFVKVAGAIGDIAKLKIGAVVKVLKRGKGFSFETGADLKELFTYKAYLEKVVDGDTLVVTIDLGFNTFLEQRLRFRGLDAPELGTKKGMASKRFVESRLRNCKFLIIKTHGSDIYDRYLVDVFYLKGETNEEKVLSEGIFLNNELLDDGFAVLV